MQYTDEDLKIISTLNSQEEAYYKKLREAGMSCEDAKLFVSLKTTIQRDQSTIECLQEGVSWDGIKQFVASKFKK